MRILVLPAAAGLACAAWVAAAVPAPSETTFSREVQPVFDRRCVACHNDDDAMGGLSLVPESAYAQLVDVPSVQSRLVRVAPSNPEGSYLVLKMRGTHISAGGRGFAMPMGFSQLTPAERQSIERWIADSAKGK